jgi:hypothetical protein
MLQVAVIVCLFAGALFYLGRLLYKAFRPTKNGCAGECKCESKTVLTPKL